MHTTLVTTDALRKVAAFKELPENQLQWIIDNGEFRTLAVGEMLFKRGDAIDQLYIILKGKFAIRIERNGNFREIGFINEGDLSGSLPFSRASTAMGYSVAMMPGEVFILHKKHFPELIDKHYELTEMLVQQMTNRVREFTKMESQNEKLMSLGKLSAGLAHELNNPASAVVRSSDALKKHLMHVPDKFKKVMQMSVTCEAVDIVNNLLSEKIQQGSIQTLNMMEKSNKEDEIIDWLDEYNVENSTELAESFVDFGVTVDELEQVRQEIGQSDLSPTLIWMDNVFTTEKLVDEIQQASNRISGLVKSIKQYTHMDSHANKEALDIREGLQVTLTILKHKLKAKNISVSLNFEENFPLINGFGGELNQVWTNLLDNAIDALPRDGQITVFAKKVHDTLMVKIIDNGKGIPANVVSNIFDPFFTTKKVGEGTGLGLDIVQRIIRQHEGDIRVESEPGKTMFILSLPILKEV